MAHVVAGPAGGVVPKAEHQGGCLCGAVRYSIVGPMRPVGACHCEQCRKTSGHYVAATSCPREALNLEDQSGALRWFDSSERAHRGFCSVCGSSLFWEAHNESTISIMAGTLELPTGLEIAEHIFTDFAGDYYKLDDDLPKLTGDDTIRRAEMKNQ